MICLLVMTDGRDELLARTIESARASLTGPITERVIYDDTGDPEHRNDLRARYPDFLVFGVGRQGFGGAIASAWTVLRSASQARFVFHLEDDFVFGRPVDLAAMARVLDANYELVQLALRRQPWNEEERAAGGIIEQYPDDYDENWNGAGAHWLEHRRFFTTNPSLYRRKLLTDHDWPEVEHSEGVFTHQLLTDPDTRFGFWGARDSGEWVEHIGVERAGIGY